MSESTDADLSPNEMRVVQHAGAPYTVVNLAGQYYAFSDTCTHRGCELHEGQIVASNQIQCPCHGARFNMTTGQVLAGPTQESLRTASVIVQDGKLVLS
jgi:nitrite reductase/ring-hydroxylating ferredoxin subunit